MEIKTIWDESSQVGRAGIIWGLMGHAQDLGCNLQAIVILFLLMQKEKQTNKKQLNNWKYLFFPDIFE